MRVVAIKGPRIGRGAGWVRASDVEAAEVAWLWQGMIPLGGITLIEGPPGCGKSTLTRDLVSRVTTGADMPGDNPACPGGALWCSSEEAVDTVLVPSLRRAGADDTKVHTLVEGGWADARKSVREMIAEHDVRMLVFDNVAVFLGPEGDDYLSVQKALAPWGALAAETGVSIIGIRHTRKSGATVAVNAGIGSIAWAGVARATITVGEIGKGRSACALAKANLGPKPDPYEFAISSEGVLQWQGRITDGDASDITNTEDRKPPSSQKKSCAEHLEALLDAQPMSMESVLAALGGDFSAKTIQNAATKLNLRRFTVEGVIFWEKRR